MKKVKFIKKTSGSHWVGDGFPVRTVFSYNDLGLEASPFLLLDYAGPYTFTPTKSKRGVGAHPHRGFETVTIVYDGEVEHRDSSGGGGLISKGDTQWMTAASGVVHEEFHSKAFGEKGGNFEMIQLWVNLSKENKMTSPRYQTLKNDTIPVVKLDDEAGVARIIAGDFNHSHGPAKTYSPINLWDLRLNENKDVLLHVPENHSSFLFVLSGKIEIDGAIVSASELVNFELKGNQIKFKVLEDAKVLFLGGEIINEPIYGHGPFVMNTREDIIQAFHDFESGKMGSLVESI